MPARAPRRGYGRLVPRPLRILEPGAAYHVYTRGNRRQAIYSNEEDDNTFLRLLGIVARQRGWDLWAYCLMPNHYHLVLTIAKPDLSRGMHWLNGVYASWFNATHGLDGHLFQGRFKSKLIESDAHLLEAIRYVVLNPVRARICAFPGDWPWSSYRATAGLSPQADSFDPRPTLALFGSAKRDPAQSFRAFVAAASGVPAKG
jgi:putative transposase